MAIERSRRSVSSKRITVLARSLLDASMLCAIATVTPRGGAHINTAYFAWSPEFDLLWLSDPGARHSRNLGANPSTGIAVHDSTQSWGESDRGIQLFGSAREIRGSVARDAERTYATRFPAYEPDELSAYRLYRFRPRRMKLFDETSLGGGVFVIATVRNGQVAWERTEVYRPEVTTPA